MTYFHGGKLINKVISKTAASKIYSYQPILKVTDDVIQDAKNIVTGVYSPLEGFLREQDFDSVLENMRLVNGAVWSIPIILDIKSEESCNQLKGARTIVLADDKGNPKAVLEDIEIYSFDKQKFAECVFGTLDRSHPGVKAVFEKGDYLIGGRVSYFEDENVIFPKIHYLPVDTRKIFQEKGWRTVVAFQTRNVPHRSHEYLQKRALEQVDGLFVQPVIGAKKAGDFK